MIKTIGLLMAVTLAPAYSTFYYAYDNDTPSSLDDADGGVYYVSYFLASTGDYGDFMINTWDIHNPNPYPYDYICKFDIDEMIVNNYYSSITAEITFNPDLVSRFGACALVLYYGDDPILSAAYGPSFFNYRTNNFIYDFNVKTNKDWTSSLEYPGFHNLVFSIDRDEIDQRGFYLYFYAYEKDLNFVKQDSYNEGFDEGYDVGLAAGHSGALFNFDWIINAVGGFLDTKIFGTFGIGDLLTIFLGVFLMIYLLKVFAGG